MEPVQMEGVNVSDAQLTEPQRPDSPEVVQVKDDLSEYKAVSALADSEGGKQLLLKLTQSITSDVESIISLFRGEELTLRCAVAKLSADLNMYRVLRNADENVKLTSEALADLLKGEKR